jgi:hypothetical protein
MNKNILHLPTLSLPLRSVHSIKFWTKHHRGLPYAHYEPLHFEEVSTQFNVSLEDVDDPRALFNYLFTQEDFEEIARNTNENAEKQGAREKFKPHEITRKGIPDVTIVTKGNGRHWQPLLAAELKIWLGILLYMGAFPGKVAEAFWNGDVWARTDQSIPWHMGATRWFQIQRYLKVSSLSSEHYWDMQSEDWWRKVYPLKQRFIERCKRMVQVGIHCSIDELLVFFKGRSKNTLSITSKAARKDYKIYI